MKNIKLFIILYMSSSSDNANLLIFFFNIFIYLNKFKMFKEKKIKILSFLGVEH